MANKTIEEWLNELPEPYKTNAIKNTPEFNKQLLVDSITMALRKGFSWDYTPQGFIYWADLYFHLM